MLNHLRFKQWATGFGVISHNSATQRWVQETLAPLCSKGDDPDALLNLLNRNRLIRWIRPCMKPVSVFYLIQRVMPRFIPIMVSISRRSGLNAMVEKGLQPGEKVVVYPGDALKDGARVNVV